MGRRAYGSVAVKQVKVESMTLGRVGQAVVVGMDVGKYEILVVARWPDGKFERPWLVRNPWEIGALVERLRELGEGRGLVVGLEPSGTYGDALRQALHDAGMAVKRVSPKAAHDYAEIFDGVPSQHDGKDAAIVAELTALGKGKPWSGAPSPPWEEELAYWVDRLLWQQRLLRMHEGRLEGLLARHWPEATQVLRSSSGTLLRALARYGGPAALAGDAEAATRLARWGGPLLRADKAQALLASAQRTTGVRQGEWERRQLREFAEQALGVRRETRACQRRLRKLAAGRAVLKAQGAVVGLTTACVLWRHLGDPHDFDCAEAYRKAMGLNLAERSSGTHQGKLKISKRGHPASRRWLYLATLRLVKRAGVQAWYQAKKARDPQGAKRALVAVMRKLTLALYYVGRDEAPFDPRRLFAQLGRKRAVAASG